MKSPAIRAFDTGGYAMAALLVAMAIMAVLLSAALPAWRTAVQREKETELIFRGQQYARAIALFQRKYANTFPPNVDILLNEHFLRKKYKDPMTADGEFQMLYANQQASAQPSAGGAVPQQGQPGRSATQAATGAAIGQQGGIIGVASKSTATSLRVYNGHEKYNEWTFVALQATNRVNAPNGSQNPTGGINFPGGAGGRGQGGREGQPQGPGGGRGLQPGGRGQNPNAPAPFGQRGGAAPPPGSPFGAPFGGGGFGNGPARGR
jgi:type II secretory pathway pseudopilin PulG